MLSAVGLTYEIAAGRVLAPFFGTSLLTWTTVIATVLAGFSLGSAIGGIVAERPRVAALRSVRGALVATAVLMAVSPTLLALEHAWGARGTGGMILSVVLVFFPASVCVTLPSPLLAKLAIEARPGREGSSLGFVLAAGSVGAIFGAILAGFVTLPLIGSTATFVACGAVALLCLPLIRGGHKGNPGVTLAAAGFVAFAGLAGSPACQYESGLSCLHVVRRGPEVRLVSDGTVQAAAVMDAFSSGSVPAHLVTRETFARLREIVDGPVYVNLLDTPDGPLARGVHAILQELYPNVEAVQGDVNARGRANILFAVSFRPRAPLDNLPDGYGPAQISDARAFTDDRGWIGHR